MSKIAENTKNIDNNLTKQALEAQNKHKTDKQLIIDYFYDEIPKENNSMFYFGKNLHTKKRHKSNIGILK